MMSYVRPEIARMTGYVPGEQPQAGKYIKLNTNENPYPASPRVVQAIHEVASAGLTRYPDPLGDAFRIRAAQLWGIEKDWILCGNGSDDILTILTRSLVGSGQRLRLPYPSYVLYKTLAEIQGASAQEIRFQSDWTLAKDFYRADPELKLVFHSQGHRSRYDYELVFGLTRRLFVRLVSLAWWFLIRLVFLTWWLLVRLVFLTWWLLVRLIFLAWRLLIRLISLAWRFLVRLFLAWWFLIRLIFLAWWFLVRLILLRWFAARFIAWLLAQYIRTNESDG